MDTTPTIHSITTLPQGTTLVVKVVRAVVRLERRRITLRQGDRLWITNAQHAQAITGSYCIAREGLNMGDALPYSESALRELFDIVA